MFTVRIQRYTPAVTKEVEIQIPSRVVITGKEDHFARAYEDAHMAIAGMRSLDEKPKEGDNPPIYRILSLLGN